MEVENFNSKYQNIQKITNVEIKRAQILFCNCCLLKSSALLSFTNLSFLEIPA